VIRKRVFIPNVLTGFNTFAGFLAILYAAEGNFKSACWLIVLAAVFDALDGKVARVTKTHSQFGLEFDSLADVVSFGVAPAVLLDRVQFHTMGTLGHFVAFLPVLFGGIRLARFNVQSSGFEKRNFVGLPIPAQAVSVSSFVLFNHDLGDGIRIEESLTALVILLCILMVSTLEYESLPTLSWRGGKVNSVKLLLLLLCGLAIAIFPSKVLFPLAIGYVLHGLLRWVYRVLKAGTEERKGPAVLSEGSPLPMNGKKLRPFRRAGRRLIRKEGP